MAVLTEDQRRKWDESNDDLFYAEPRFVQHLDEAFRRRLTRLYRQEFRPAPWCWLMTVGSAICPRRLITKRSSAMD